MLFFKRTYFTGIWPNSRLCIFVTAFARASRLMPDLTRAMVRCGLNPLLSAGIPICLSLGSICWKISLSCSWPRVIPIQTTLMRLKLGKVPTPEKVSSNG